MTNIIPFSGTSKTLTQTKTVKENPSLLQRIFNRTSTNTSRTLEEIIDADDNLQIYSNNQLNALNPKILYGINQFNFNSSIFRHQREESLHVPDGQTILFTLMNNESQNKLKERKHNFIHLGLIAFGIRTLTRKGTGAMALIILYDDRHKQNDKAIIGLAEVDLNAGSALTYIVPNFALTITDFCRHIKIAIQTRGFENFTGDNIGLDIIFLGKTMTHIRNKFRLKITNLIDTVSSKGIKFIPAKEISSTTLAGLEWNANLNLEEVQVIKPNSFTSYTDRKGNFSIRFENYSFTQTPEEEEDDTQENP